MISASFAADHVLLPLQVRFVPAYHNLYAQSGSRIIVSRRSSEPTLANLELSICSIVEDLDFSRLRVGHIYGRLFEAFLRWKWASTNCLTGVTCGIIDGRLEGKPIYPNPSSTRYVTILWLRTTFSFISTWKVKTAYVYVLHCSESSSASYKRRLYASFTVLFFVCFVRGHSWGLWLNIQDLIICIQGLLNR